MVRAPRKSVRRPHELHSSAIGGGDRDTYFVLSGAVDGHVRAYSTTNGAVLWDYDTAKPFTTVNEIKANGGALILAGRPSPAECCFVSSGYGLYGGQAGNVLLALEPRP